MRLMNIFGGKQKEENTPKVDSIHSDVIEEIYSKRNNLKCNSIRIITPRVAYIIKKNCNGISEEKVNLIGALSGLQNSQFAMDIEHYREIENCLTLDKYRMVRKDSGVVILSL